MSKDNLKGVAPLDNTRVAKPPLILKIKLTPELVRNLLASKFAEYYKRNQARIYDADKAKYYKNLLDFYNNNFFGYGVQGNQTKFDPTTSEGQTAILSNFNYAKDNALNFMINVAGVGALAALYKAILKAGLIYDKVIKSPFKQVSSKGSLGTMKQYIKNGTIGGGAEAVVVRNTPTTVGKITTIPVKEMAERNAIPNTVQSKYIGYVKDKGTKLPTYILRKVKTLTEETFPRYVGKLDNAMAKSGFKRVNDPNVLYRAYTNGLVVVDDVAPGNVGLDWLRRPRMIDFNLLTVPEWTALGFTLKNGGRLISKYLGGNKILEQYSKYAILGTYYPFISDYPFTGHSKLNITGAKEGRYKSYSIDKGGKNKDYNLVTNNCSDATRCALEKIFNKKINPFLFTTPGDVLDFALSELNGIPEIKGDSIYDPIQHKYKLDTRPKHFRERDRGESTVYIPLNDNLRDALILYIILGNINNIFKKGGKIYGL